MNNQNRWKSYILWAAVAALVGDALIDLGLLGDLNKFNSYVDKVFYILMLLGIVNNPTNKTGL
jgi:uncharacterized membrane protein